MWTLGKFVVMTRGELWKMNKDADARGYSAGLRSKWRTKKKEDETERLLAAIDPSVVIPSRNAETYAQGPTTYGDSLPITAGELPSEINPQRDAA